MKKSEYDITFICGQLNIKDNKNKIVHFNKFLIAYTKNIFPDCNCRVYNDQYNSLKFIYNLYFPKLDYNINGKIDNSEKITDLKSFTRLMNRYNKVLHKIAKDINNSLSNVYRIDINTSKIENVEIKSNTKLDFRIDEMILDNNKTKKSVSKNTEFIADLIKVNKKLADQIADITAIVREIQEEKENKPIMIELD